LPMCVRASPAVSAADEAHPRDAIASASMSGIRL
jgi:hypothetical protein